MKDRSVQQPGDIIPHMPLVPLRDIVVFPYTMVPFVVGRKSSLGAVEKAVSGGRRIFLATQRDAKVDDPSSEEINALGTVANIVQSLKLPNGNVKLLVEGSARARAIEIEEASSGYFAATLKIVEKRAEKTPEIEPLMTKVVSLFEKYVKYSPNLPYEAQLSTIRVTDAGRLTDTIAAHLNATVEQKQSLLETIQPRERLEIVARLLEDEIEKLRMDRKIQSRVKKQMEKAQKEYYLNEKMKAIQQELGRRDDRVNEIDEFRQKIEKARMPKEAREKALQELKRLEVMPPVSAEATVSRNYLEWLLAVPWSRKSRELRDIKKAEAILEADHFGLDKVKERILEFLAVRQLVRRRTRGSILCFVGPPGVGKTSLAKSIARATGRKFARLSLGGVRDEAEIRGHRRTYIGAFPGQIIQMMRKAGTRNPVFLLDEVDKMSTDFRGDPSSALLEVLDPEQNDSFLDHYLDTEFDLSEVMFIATANVMHTIPAALKDRMEVIRIAGYTLNEKQAIAERFLLPKQLSEHGLDAEIGTKDPAGEMPAKSQRKPSRKKRHEVGLSGEAVQLIIERYTREAGVRNLEREIASICRKIARRVVGEGLKGAIEIGPDEVTELLGVPRYHPQHQSRTSEIGTATGLAWTEVGGELLTTEASIVPGKGTLTLTGKLGEVMRESAQAALTYVRSRAGALGIPDNFHRKFDLHIHVPEGAIPKDGPSAGITIATALASLLTKIPIRRDVAMTGEVTLRGKVLPVGGVKEKVLAAYRYGMRRIILPRENEKDLSEIPEDIQKVLEFKLVANMDEVLDLALDREAAGGRKVEDEGLDKSLDEAAPDDRVTH